MPKTYELTATFRVIVHDNVPVAQEPSAVAMAVRDYLLTHTSTSTTAGGYDFVRPFIVNAEEEG